MWKSNYISWFCVCACVRVRTRVQSWLDIFQKTQLSEFLFIYLVANSANAWQSVFGDSTKEIEKMNLFSASLFVTKCLKHTI